MSQEIRRNSGSEAGDPDLPIGGLCGLLYHPCGSENRPQFIPWETSSVSLMMFPYEMVNHHIYIYFPNVSLVMVNNDVYHQCYYGFVCLFPDTSMSKNQRDIPTLEELQPPLVVVK